MTAAAVEARRAAVARGAGTRVLVVEDHETVARALVVLLRAEGMEADSAPLPGLGGVVAKAEEFSPHVVLLDLDLGPDIGLATPLIDPLSAVGAAVVMLSGVTDERLLAECVEQGAVGVLDKADTADAVIGAIRTAAGGGRLMSDDDRFTWLARLRRARAEEAARKAPFDQLTPRERDVLGRLADGLSPAEIADLQFVSVFTVRGHIRSILTKLGVGSQLAAVAMARRAGWL